MKTISYHHSSTFVDMLRNEVKEADLGLNCKKLSGSLKRCCQLSLPRKQWNNKDSYNWEKVFAFLESRGYTDFDGERFKPYSPNGGLSILVARPSVKA